MSTRSKILLGFAAAGLVFAFLLLVPGAGARGSLEETRRALRRLGFKVDLAEFDFTTSPEMRERAAALTNALPLGPLRPVDSYGRRWRIMQDHNTFVAPRNG